ncbi:phosphate ABC transporter permease subunit PstC [Halapricum hydrolyticum]|uniref:Phosphate transport system permease protein n=1 Tax=Halapricum hydrolyticum TaxID=2979991 RepID=A0AAE3LI51_9EURY|nr:phosphate ABC transporter permease subunit PstC [Halapricum hydrolyticum]MCU4716482.1 phosphate ABC transporter permease subunit PstC [Halapricum hydrolyticum]MCU4725913.1 phosphate ABC transporter permease subunit PstC [Halapricum hydrolyticum]
MSSETRDIVTDETNASRTAKEQTYRAIFLACGILSVLTTVAIIATLFSDALTFWSEVPIEDFLLGTNWSPQIEGSYGVLPLVSATLLITFGSAVVALPIGVLTAIYLSEYASDRTRSILKPTLEILAGVPTVVYGFFALVYVTPALGTIFPSISTFNALSASLVVGIMIIPMVSSISEDAMSAVPDSLRQASYGLGATKFEVSTTVVVPAAISGIFSSFILALSRAIGETMIVTIAAGSNARLIDPLDPFSAFLNSVEPMTAAMINIGKSDVDPGSLTYKSLFAIGLTLFAITFVMNVVSNLVAERYREEYE